MAIRVVSHRKRDDGLWAVTLDMGAPSVEITSLEWSAIREAITAAFGVESAESAYRAGIERLAEVQDVGWPPVLFVDNDD